MLEQGTVPWRQPWNVRHHMPRNLVSKKSYRGRNLFLLLAAQYASPFWLTWNQATKLGGNVKKGEKAWPVIFWKMREVDKNEGMPGRKIPFLRYYRL